MRHLLGSLLLLAAVVRPLAAQEYEVSRRSYVFFGRGLSIEVTADGSGALQVLRGEPGQLEVAARAEDGLAAFGLGGYRGDELRLSALGARETNYIVVVPEHVSVSVLLPGQRFASRVPDGPAPVLRWDGAYVADVQAAAVPPIAPGVNGLFLVHRADVAPPGLSFVKASIRSLEIRLGAQDFRVSASEPLAYQPGTGPVRVRTGERAIDLLVEVPAGTRFFDLRSDGEALLTVAEGNATSDCRGVRVLTSNGLVVYRFAGAQCR